ncbi:MAG: DUF302 domain-containing protein [Alphaproteobacteria bacterium]|nr:DUF302 domain-containing protein [Alphaproteobacteria bacterium]
MKALYALSRAIALASIATASVLAIAGPAAAAGNAAAAASKAPRTVDVRSANDFSTTLANLKQAIERRRLNIFAEIDHAKGAMSVGETLRPTTLLIFGNPTGGTPFMRTDQRYGIVLPLKALVWEDGNGAVTVSVIDLPAETGEDVAAMARQIAGALVSIAEEAAAATDG